MESPVFSDLDRFPVYVSYPAFFSNDDAIEGANNSIFTRNSGSCGCRD